MRRQKVKGTGTKRPVDANTEPNFYAMPPIPPSPASVNAGPYSPARQMLPEPMTHSSPGLHGAAHLLRGFAVGSPVGLPQIPLLGPASVGGEVRALGLPPKNRSRLAHGEMDANSAPVAPNTI